MTKPPMTHEQREAFKKQNCGLTNEQWADQLASAIIAATQANIASIRRAAELENTVDGKRALNTVANILEDTNT